MLGNIVVLGGSAHPQLTSIICKHLGLQCAKVLLSKFAVGETRVEVQESVRDKDVFIIQSGGGKVNDHLMELLITISACKTASARRVTAVLPFFPYSRQNDIPYDAKTNTRNSTPADSQPQSPHSGRRESAMVNGNTDPLHKQLGHLRMNDKCNVISATGLMTNEDTSSASVNGINGTAKKVLNFQPRPGYQLWTPQAGTLVAGLLSCAGADHVITMDLHDPQYQGFFDIPVDNLYSRTLLRRYIQQDIPNYRNAVVVSPDAGGAKRATIIADDLGIPFALIHKERRSTQFTDRQSSMMMLVGNVANKVTILIDDLADTSKTITRAATLLKREGATQIYALLTHGILSGDAIDRINASPLDKVIVTNSVDQAENLQRCPKLEVLEVGPVFAEAIRRVHHGESVSVLFHYDY